MNFSQRSYTNGETFRPKPILIEKPESGLIVIATPWGPVESAHRVAEIVSEQFELLAREDMTSPFESVPSLSAAANRLRIGVLAANAYLCKNENAKQWKSAVELTAIHYARGVLSWVHVGSPHILLHDGQHIHPVAYDVDWTSQSQNKGPLFSQALGLDSNPALKAGSVRLRKAAQILLLSRSTVPGGLFTKDHFELENLLEDLVQDQSAEPCWVGVLNLDESYEIATDTSDENNTSSDLANSNEVA